MQKKFKMGFALALIGALILSAGYLMLRDFREREEDLDRKESEETLLEHEVILALNFCGAIFLGAGVLIMVVKVLDIRLRDEKDEPLNDDKL
ncbi:MAG: hypothetical protein ACOCTR_05755 [Candidatus Natronoplasma sp.]